MHNINIKTKTDFINFIKQLQQDLENNPDGWENKTLPEFLEAIQRYTEDIQGYYNNTSQNIDSTQASWKVFADILMGAKVYE
ncbi:hypothetical protein AM493_18030 [Flavobacterium akiainvivens]|uniref:DUF7660 domain-containing protein n=1 Tax=Flavobacterium akiainvivens TaxID=1202724 RepID=A0A0M8MBK8_9FLAO|nr:hypothetical protein [Flavobacterium akiainvivens]KOS07733.1 hypothetical protein AM493_18030 [Flavobacterium akiainvivens]SFQ25230.1 hypothetical protein SAMN05444144_102187 [Flavobacterium akiainvivens]